MRTLASIFEANPAGSEIGTSKNQTRFVGISRKINFGMKNSRTRASVYGVNQAAHSSIPHGGLVPT